MRKILGDFISVVRELSLDELREDAMTAPRLLVIGHQSTASGIVRDLFGAEARTLVMVEQTVPEAETERFDLAVCLWDGGSTRDLTTAISAIRSRGWPMAIVGTTDEARLSPLPAVDLLPLGPSIADLAGARVRLVDLMEENRLLALGRELPEMRAPIAGRLVQMTARANAQFAVVSSIPALVPLLGNLLGAAGDFLVLTKNQLLLVYKLAAVYGRDIDDRRQVYLEMVPVIGAGLLWRTVARELLALVPSVLGAVPKIAIAYTGTFVVGRAAHYYYEEGRRPTREDWERFYQTALEWLGTLRQTLDQRARMGRGREPANETTVTIEMPPARQGAEPARR